MNNLNLLDQLDTIELDAECEVISSIVEYSCKQHEIEMFYMENFDSALKAKRPTEYYNGAPNNMKDPEGKSNESDIDRIKKLPTDVKPVKLIQRILDWGSRMLSKIKILINVTIMKNCFNKLLKMSDKEGNIAINLGKMGVKFANTKNLVKIPKELENYLHSTRVQTDVAHLIGIVYGEKAEAEVTKTFDSMKDLDSSGASINDMTDAINSLVGGMTAFATLQAQAMRNGEDPTEAAMGRLRSSDSLKEINDVINSLQAMTSTGPTYNWRINYEEEAKKFDKAMNNLKEAIKVDASEIVKRDKNSAKIKFTKDMDCYLVMPTPRSLSGKRIPKLPFGTQFILHTVIMHLDDIMKLMAKDQLKWKGAFEGSTDKVVTDDELKKYHQFVKANYTHYVHLMTIVFKKLAEFTKTCAKCAKILSKSMSVTKSSPENTLIDVGELIREIQQREAQAEADDLTEE